MATSAVGIKSSEIVYCQHVEVDLEFHPYLDCDHATRPPGVLASDSASCNMGCAGNESEICGDPNRINVYWVENGKPGPANPATVGAGAFADRGYYIEASSPI